MSGLGGRLRDRARVIRKSKTSTRTEGGYQKTTGEGPWFRCYYDPGQESESRGPGSVHRRRSGAQLVCGRRALDGSLIDLQASDVIEVNSQTHGTLRLDVVGAPEPLGLRRTRKGWLAQLGATNRKAPG